jgi:flagellar biosynthesis chaperone FliJ
MIHSRSLNQLLRIRQLEEEESRTELERALGELNRLERALMAARKKESHGREWVLTSVLRATEIIAQHQRDADSVVGEESIDRRAGIEDQLLARRLIEALRLRINAQQLKIDEIRSSFLAHRVQRRQVEALIEAESKRHQSEMEHRAQQSVDDWFGSRHRPELHAASLRDRARHSKKPSKN